MNKVAKNGRFPLPGWVVFWSLVALILVTFPYVLAYTTARPGTLFTGTLMNPEDSHTYFAKMVAGYNGHLLYAIPFTPEPHEPAFLGVFYVWLGLLARLFGVSIDLVWHLARIVADLFLFGVIYRFITYFLTNWQERKLAFLLSLFGGGFGWVLFLLNQPYWLDHFPVDFKQPGSHIFFTALTFPHVAFGTACLLLSVMDIHRLQEAVLARRSWWRIAGQAGLTLLLLGIAYPFLVYLVAVVVGLYWGYQVWQAKRPLWRVAFIWAIPFLLASPLYLYYAWVLQTNEIFRAWDAQALTPSPPWPHYLVAYAPFLVLAGWHWWKRPSDRTRFVILWCWILAAAILVYAPLNPQRRFVQGVHVPLSILTTMAFCHLFLPALARTRLWQTLLQRPRYTSNGLTGYVATLFLVFMSLSNFYIFASVSVSSVVQQPDLIFRPVAEKEAALWVWENLPETAVILSEYQSGNYIAGRTGRRVVIGHWAETVDFEQRQIETARFFDANTSDEWRKQLLTRYHVNYLWYGPREQALGDFNPETADYLTPRYTNHTITIYAVTPALATP
ncbi:MAG: hypothetical protein D6706_21105 [Chloroflexi bacterium]|nr:MAG: hypothetical protein D6706_21105 [Chloroflexota bacterium]